MKRELEKIAGAKKELLALVGTDDKEKAEQLISDMLSAQAQSDIEEVELCIPTKSVDKRADLGPVEFVQTPSGVLFNAKGSMSVFVSARQKLIYDTLSSIMDEVNDNFKSVPEDVRDIHEQYTQAWTFLLQAPLFCILRPEYVFDAASLLIKNFNEYTKENIADADTKEETAEDVAKNNEFSDHMNMIEDIKSEIGD